MNNHAALRADWRAKASRGLAGHRLVGRGEA